MRGTVVLCEVMFIEILLKFHTLFVPFHRVCSNQAQKPVDGCNNRQPLGHETPCFKNAGLCDLDDLGRRASLTGMQGQ